MRNSVCAIIVTYNIGRAVINCFDSIKGQVEEVVVADNGSDSETLSVLGDIEKDNSNVKVFYNGRNLGIAAAFNIGVHYAAGKKYKYVLLLDHDSEATPGMVDKLLEAYRLLGEKCIGDIAIVAANAFDKNAQRYIVRQSLFNDGKEIAEVRNAISAGSLVNIDVFASVGMFNEALFAYYVDDDFCLRCREKKWKIFICKEAVLLHEEGRKEIRKFFGKEFVFRNYDFRASYYISRNGIYMLKSFFKSYRYGSCLIVVERQFSDMFKVILFDKTKGRVIRFMLRGIWDGIINRYGKLETEGVRD
jgi:rhamnosyltransferase